MNLFDLCVYKNLNKGSGGDVDVSSLVATENKTYNAGEGKAYNPVVVNVPTPSPSLQSLTASHNGYFVPSSGYDGFDEVTVDVATPLETLSATENGTYTPSSGYEGFSEVTVDVPLPNNAYLLESQKNDVVTIQNGAEFDMPKLIVSIEPQQSGSGDPSPENIRPISGWTACNVVRAGENLFDKATITENKIIDSTTGEETAFYGRFSSDYIKVNPLTDYYASNVIRAAQWYCVFYYDKNKNYLSCGDLPSTGDTASGVITTPSGCNYVRLVSLTTYKDDVSLVVGNQAPTIYEPYNGQTYTIDLDGTRYGGKLDVVNGVLTVDRVSVDLGTLNYSAYGGTSSYDRYISSSIDSVAKADGLCVSDIYTFKGTQTMSANQIWVGGGNSKLSITTDVGVYNDASAFKTAMSGHQLVYELATPQTYQLTPTEVKSLLGVNNIFADTGEVDVQIWTKEVTS